MARTWTALFFIISALAGYSQEGEIRPGIVVEQIAPHGEDEKAGLQEGDILLSWSRGNSKGEIQSPFDLVEIETEQKPLGMVKVEGLRGAEKRAWFFGPDSWGLVTRPNFSGDLQSAYLEGWEFVKTGKDADIVKAAERWQATAGESRQPLLLRTWLLLAAANTMSRNKHWKDADSAYEQVQRLVEKQQDSSVGEYHQRATQLTSDTRATLLIQLFHAWAESLVARREFEIAIKYYERAIAECRAVSTKSFNEALLLKLVGSIAMNRGELDRAQQSFLQAQAILQEIAPSCLLMSSVLNGLGNVAGNQGDLARAETYYHRALEIAEAVVPGSFQVAAVLSNLGTIAEGRGDSRTADQYLNQALRIQEKVGPNSMYAAHLLNTLGAVAGDRGDVAKAEEYVRRALQIEQELYPDDLDAALSTEALGELALLRSDLVSAEHYLRKALLIWKKLVPDSINMAQTLESLGETLRDQGNTHAAKACLLEAVAIFQKLAPESPRFAASLDDLASVLIDHDVENAEEQALHALAIREKLAPGSLAVASSLTTLGDLAQRRGNLAEAISKYRQALAIQEKLIPGTIAYAETLAKLASLLHRQQLFEDAKPLYAQAVNALESQTARLGGSEEIRSSFRANHSNIYRDYVDLLLMLKQPERAFEVLERSRARILLEMLTAVQVDIRKGANPSLLEQERSLRQLLTAKLNRRLSLLVDKNSENQVAAFAREIGELEKQYQVVEERLRSNSPEYASLTQPQPLTVGQIQQLLDPNTLLLEYSLSDQRSYVFALTSNSLTSYELPKRTEIEAKAQIFYSLLTERSRTVKGESEQQRHARLMKGDAQLGRVALELSRMLVKPVEAELQQRRLLVVSDGALQYLPFAVLPTPASFSPKNAQLLISKHEVINLPSASVMTFLQKRHTPGKEVAIFADPVFNSRDLRVKWTASNPMSNLGQPANSISMEADSPFHNSFSRSMADMNLEESGEVYLPRLAFTRDEAKAIQALVPPERRMEALGFNATREKAMSPELANYRVVHFATHALVDNIHPELSGLVLSLVNQKGEPVDGFLDLQDIYNLDLPADLVVLSACQTALGKQISGEGMIGLTRGFMYAGASRVLATLWKVDDFATAKFMAHFYKALERDKMTPAQALRQAQVELLKERPWSAPYFWAGFTLQGDWR